MGIGFGGRFPSSLGRHVDSSPLYIENSFDETPTECRNPSKHPSLTVKLQTSWEYSPKPNVPSL